MAFEMPVLDVSFVAAADLSGSQYAAVTLDGNGKAVLATTAGEVCVGVLQNDPRAGETAQVRVYGVTMVKAGAAVTPGQLVSNDASGLAVPATTGQVALGIALDGAAGAGQIISVLLDRIHVA